MKNIWVPAVGGCAVSLNGFGRVPVVVERRLGVGVKICIEGIVDRVIVGWEVFSHSMARLDLMVLNWAGIIIRAGPLRLAWILDILRIGIAGAGLGGLVHLGIDRLG
jgi:hypothetical protein